MEYIPYFRVETLENDTLWGGTNLDGSCMGVSPPHSPLHYWISVEFKLQCSVWQSKNIFFLQPEETFEWNSKWRIQVISEWFHYQSLCPGLQESPRGKLLLDGGLHQAVSGCVTSHSIYPSILFLVFSFFSRNHNVDISVAVSTDSGLITPIVFNAAGKVL